MNENITQAHKYFLFLTCNKESIINTVLNKVSFHRGPVKETSVELKQNKRLDGAFKFKVTCFDFIHFIN